VGIRAWYRGLNEPLFPPLEVHQPSASPVKRLFSTSVGPLGATIGPHGFLMLTRYDVDGNAAIEVSRYYGIELVTAVEAAEVPTEEAAGIAEQIEHLVPPMPSYPRKRFMLGRLLFAFLWRSLLGVYAIERFIRRRQRR
jgi:hypothetical protein